jgi:hypothetical protein
VRLIHLEDGDTVVAVARVAEGDDESEAGSGNGRAAGDEGSPGGEGAAGPPPAGPESSH